MTLHGLLLLALLPAARATGAAMDTELVRPTLSAGTLPGVDGPWIEAPGTLRLGAVSQYQRDPLVLYERGEEAGTVVTHRQALHLGLALALGRGAAARVVLPAALQWGSQVPSLAGDGALLGDLRAGFRLVPPLDGPARAGLRADVILPTGARQAWVGEGTPRADLGLVAGLRGAGVDGAVDLGLQVRAPRQTEVDLDLGQELHGGLGLRVHVWPERAALTGGVVARAGLTPGAPTGGAFPAELLAGVQLWPGRDLQLDLDLGKGLSAGYGTTELRTVAGLTWIRRPAAAPPPALPVVTVEELPDLPPAPAEAPPAEGPAWREGELARVEQERIVIRDPIQFAFNTDRILPASLPTLAFVARVLAQEPSIGHLVIEGHASDEGSYDYNYRLSLDRARAVWEALVAEGVHPERISIRGMGEVVPVRVGTDEAALAANRRVELRIAWRRAPGDEALPPGGAGLLPWNGQPVQIQAPPPDPLPAPPPPPAEDEELVVPALDPRLGDPGGAP